jgi:hypothetical protein
METTRVNEETAEGNYVIQTLNPANKQWQYITTEFSVSIAIIVMTNLFIATKQKCRVCSRRSKNQVIAEL